MSFAIRTLGSGDGALLEHVAQGVFDDPLHPPAVAEFLSNPHHHIVVAITGGVVVGFASAVHYLHPDKPSPEMWINEVGVSPEYQGRGLAKAILDTLFEVAKGLGCREAWVLTERANSAAIRLYQSRGGAEAVDDPVMFTFRLDPT